MEVPIDPKKSVKEQISEWFILGDQLFSEGSEPFAAGYYQWITEVDPKNALAWRMLGLCCLTSLGGESRALEALKKAVDLDPSDKVAESSLKQLQERLAQNPNIIDQGVRKNREIIKELLAGSNSAETTPSVEKEKAESTDPPQDFMEDVRARPVERQLFMTQLFMSSGSYKEALEICEMILKVEPENFDAISRQASCLSRLGKHHKAINLLKKLAKNNPDSIEAWHNLGCIYAEARDIMKALECFKRAADLGSEIPETWLHLAACYYEIYRQEHAEQALAFISKAISLSPDLGPAFGLKGRILDDLGRDEEALVFYDRCLQLIPGSRGEMFGRGNVLSKLNRFDEAKQQFEQVTVVDSENTSAWANLGVCMFASGQQDEAMNLIVKAISHFPHDTLLPVIWCDLRRRQKNLKEDEMTEREYNFLHQELHIELKKLK